LQQKPRCPKQANPGVIFSAHSKPPTPGTEYAALTRQPQPEPYKAFRFFPGFLLALFSETAQRPRFTRLRVGKVSPN
jgi:hypothetical protein